MEGVPQSDAELVRRIVSTNQHDLENQLTAFEARVRRGERGGGGVLGHITEYLVSQRGLTR